MHSSHTDHETAYSGDPNSHTSPVRASDRELADWIISLSRGTTPEEFAQTLRGRFSEVRPGG
jgi:hypothetical protein